MLEEPTAGNPHGGVCTGALGAPAHLPGRATMPFLDATSLPFNVLLHIVTAKFAQFFSVIKSNTSRF